MWYVIEERKTDGVWIADKVVKIKGLAAAEEHMTAMKRMFGHTSGVRWVISKVCPEGVVWKN